MDKFEQQEERLLEGENESERDGDASRQNFPKRMAAGKGVRGYLPAVVLCLLVVSMVWNVVLVGTIRTLGRQERCRTDFAGLQKDETIPYQMMTDFMDQNRSVSDRLWTDLDSHPIIIALDNEYVEKHDLHASAICPQDESKQLYQVQALHHIHCLKSVRMAYFDALEAGKDDVPSMPPQHVAHCLDVLRQDIMCAADDTPTAFHKHGHEKKGGEPRQCRSWEKLVQWTMEGGRQSCFTVGLD